ncbi:hypothetical protein RHA1_ro03195 [Rhodococcus jostii RHA1]|uniref:Uncharacterized protein n=1 Tax=Rhodococcus jostii (strain RHA1) TaxID=101510 RepID=Q0SBT8_RHOJR|nr:hypothetical protein [Rhodococcus jostii]ABG94998.1 hypothetical protein RHA1_ro03195 [Rhodococcus jostii RHA1]
MTEGPTGDVVVGYGRYTRCVAKSTYSNPAFSDGVVAFVFSLFGWGTSWAAVAEDGCDYLLGRKLVCLGGVHCAIGTIAGIEKDKSFPENIDNDFCVNLLLFPHETVEFIESDFEVRARIARGEDRYPPQNRLSNWQKVTSDGIQGALILHDPDTMPVPDDPRTDGSAKPYSTTYIRRGATDEGSPYEQKEDEIERNIEENILTNYSFGEVPVLHCEFEGARIFMVCRAVAPFLDLATGVGDGCRAALGGIPLIGDVICDIIETVVAWALFPIMVTAIANAWEDAREFDEELGTGPVKRWVELDEPVIVTGEWVWDGSHQGWNEIHPVHTMQKIVLPPRTGGHIPPADADNFVKQWCRLVLKVPLPGQPLTAMTPEQQDTHIRQQRPENQWAYHPDIDGCLPREIKPEVPIV